MVCIDLPIDNLHQILTQIIICLTEIIEKLIEFFLVAIGVLNEGGGKTALNLFKYPWNYLDYFFFHSF